MNAHQRRKSVKKFRKNAGPRLIYARMLGMSKVDTDFILSNQTHHGQRMLEEFIQDKIWSQTRHAS